MFSRARWLAVVLPGLLVGLIELFSDTTLDDVLPFPWDTMLVVLVVVVLASAFSFVTFRRIDALAGALARQNAELEQRNATVRALHRVSLAITAMNELDRILQAIVEQARVLLGADGAALVVDGRSGDPMRQMTSGLDVAGVSVLGGGSRLEAPLQVGGETFGSIVVGSGRERSYGADEVETLSSLANQAAIACEHARLQDRLRGLAVAEERERIAREMHDGLAQVLGYVNTKSQAVESLLDHGRVVEARGQLDQLAAAARSIYVDVREAILGLRSAIDPGTGVVQAIETYGERIAEASKLVVDVTATDAARSASLPEPAERHLFRVVQEALTNVRKHAHARRVAISLEVADGALVVRVVDDGRGMAVDDKAASDWPRYGLAAMRERAAAMGGSIDWATGPEGGTVVRLATPILPGTLDGGSDVLGLHPPAADGSAAAGTPDVTRPGS